MTSAHAPHRLFVAAHPPIEVARDYLRALERVDLAEHRATAPEQAHLTLHFIGPVDPRGVDAIAESVSLACAGIAPFDLTPARLVTMPARGEPRLVALDLAPHPSAAELHTRLVRRLARSPKGNPGRDYRPHLTLCRFTRPARPSRVDAPVELPAFRVDRVSLVRSVLRPDGAEHREVGAWALEP
ncbi:MAG: RNA 2',3'-cyclic phosphodiesterase [Phycisphaerales bacterium]